MLNIFNKKQITPIKKIMKKSIIIILSAVFLTSCSVKKTPTENHPIFGSNIFPQQKTSYIYFSKDNDTEKSKLHKKKPFYVLEIAGGAFGGIIPLKILNYIEKKSGKPISEFFDLIVGTSTGTVISSLLTVPDKNNNPKYNVSDVLTFYEKLGKTVFYDPLSHKLGTTWGLEGPLYDRNNWNEVLDKLLGDNKISQSLTNIIMTEYSMSLRRIFYFNSMKAKKDKNYEFLTSDAVLAATSTPLIFSPKYYCNITNTFCDRGLDAGIAINNPVVRSYLFAKEIAQDRPIILLSLGDGIPEIITNKQISNNVDNWGILKLRSWLGIFQKAINNSSNQEMINIIKHIPENNIRAYIRINEKFGKNINVFNPSKKDIDSIIETGNKAVSNNTEYLNYLIELKK